MEDNQVISEQLPEGVSTEAECVCTAPQLSLDNQTSAVDAKKARISVLAAALPEMTLNSGKHGGQKKRLIEANTEEVDRSQYRHIFANPAQGYERNSTIFLTSNELQGIRQGEWKMFEN